MQGSTTNLLFQTGVAWLPTIKRKKLLNGLCQRNSMTTLLRLVNMRSSRENNQLFSRFQLSCMLIGRRDRVKASMYPSPRVLKLLKGIHLHLLSLRGPHHNEEEEFES